MYLRRTPCNLPFGQRVRFLDCRFHTSNSYLLKRREPSPHSLLHRIVKTTQASIRNRRNRKFMIQPPPHNPTITDPHNLIPRTLESMRDISPHVEHLNTLPRHITQTIRLHALLPRNPISVLERILPILEHSTRAYPTLMEWQAAIVKGGLPFSPIYTQGQYQG